MIERRGYCNRCGLCELGGPRNGLVIWDPEKKPGEENACYHRLIRDLRSGRNRGDVLREWQAREPTFDGDMDAYLSFPATPDAVIEGCNYRFYDSDRELPPKRSENGRWVYPQYDRTQFFDCAQDRSVVLNERLYGEV